jgi:three-Cys-motif partner protein
MTQGHTYDEIGYWSEIKLDIIKEYAASYSLILSGQKRPSLYHIYIDAFAGAGKHISKKTGTFVLGSPMNALFVKPAFREYHFIDLNKQKIASLEEAAGSRQDVHIYHGDCNHVLLEKVLPNAKYKDYRRALCILDPYGLHLDWEVIYTVGQMKSIDVFLNFPIADMNRNVLRREPEGVSTTQIDRMNRFWGDESWKQAAYFLSKQRKLFGDADIEKASNEKIAEAFRKRLKKVAGFKNIPKPIAMRNTQNAVVYYLFFASHKLVAEDIIKYIFNKYKDKRG